MQYDHEEMQEIMGRSFAVDADVDEEELMGELDLIEDELALEASAPASNAAVPAFLEEPEMPAAPQGRADAAQVQQLGAGMS
jgi:charged multivesicular body protein 5